MVRFCWSWERECGIVDRRLHSNVMGLRSAAIELDYFGCSNEELRLLYTRGVRARGEPAGPPSSGADKTVVISRLPFASIRTIFRRRTIRYSR